MDAAKPPWPLPAAERAGDGGKNPREATGKPSETVGLQSYGN